MTEQPCLPNLEPLERVRVNAAERWLPVPGYEGAYEVSDHGNVRSVDRYTRTRGSGKRKIKGSPLVLFRNNRGYLIADLHNNGSRKHRFVHCIVASAFIGPRPDGMEVCHNNGNRIDNQPENLRYGTAAENSADRMVHSHGSSDHCPRGHELSAGNLVPAELARGYRTCLACNRAHTLISDLRRRTDTDLTDDVQLISDYFLTNFDAKMKNNRARVLAALPELKRNAGAQRVWQPTTNTQAA